MAAENTAFRIGSISKTFVAVAALKLAERGLIDMDRDIAAPLEPDFPAFERPASMRMLLTHSAGYKDMVTGTAVPNVSDTLPLGMGHTTFADALVRPSPYTARADLRHRGRPRKQLFGRQHHGKNPPVRRFGQGRAPPGIDRARHSIDGQALTPVGRDTYGLPMGILFLLKRDGRIWIGTQSATTYREAPFWAGQSAQACVPAAAFLLLKLTLVCALIAPLHGRAKKDAVMTACPAVEIALLCALAGTFFSASRPSGC